MTLRRIVVLGTGTDVGKTYVSTCLAAFYRAEGGQCLALKPIESGLSESNSPTNQPPTEGDAAALYAAASAGARPLYAFRDPISPHLAARREGRHIDLDRIVQYISEQEERLVTSSRSVETWIPPEIDLEDPIPASLSQQRAPSTSPPPSSNPSPASSRRSGPLPPICLIETAGGVFSPVSDTKTNWDVTQAVKPDAIILVAPDSLGVLHDVQSTLRAMAPHRPHALILSAARPADSSTGSNLKEIENVVLSQLRLKFPCVPCPKNESLGGSLLRVLAG